MLNLRHKDNPRIATPLALLFFDRYNVEDPLFVADVARRLAVAARSGFRAMVVHASDDAAARARDRHVAAGSQADQESELVERAVRMANQSVTRRMIDEGVSAVSIQGNDRGLFRLAGDGSLEVGHTEWLERAVSMGGVPVISLLADDRKGRAAEAGAAAALEHLVAALSGTWTVTTVFFTTNRKSALFEADGSRLESVARDRLSSFEEVPDFSVAVGASAASAVFVTNSAGLGPDGMISGTRIT